MRILIAAITIICAAVNVVISASHYLDGDIGRATFFLIAAFMLAYLGREIEREAK